MKAKKLVFALAALLGASTLAACGATDNKITFGNYWQKNALSEGEKVEETLTYAVNYEKNVGADGLGYTFDYGEGSYVTKLSTTAEGYRHTSILTIPVTYTFGEQTKEFTDVVTTTVDMQNTSAGLRPISSIKEVLSHTPVNTTPTDIKGCYMEYAYTVTTTYKEGAAASSVVNYLETETTKASTSTSDFTYGQEDYSYLDNEQLLLALRAIPSSVTSTKVEAYNPFVKSTQLINFTFSATTGASFSYKLNGTDVSNKEISYRPVNITLDAKNPGASQTAWIATTSNPENNENRNMMLKLETPLSYNFGKLIYTLKEVQNV